MLSTRNTCPRPIRRRDPTLPPTSDQVSPEDQFIEEYEQEEFLEDDILLEERDDAEVSGYTDHSLMEFFIQYYAPTSL